MFYMKAQQAALWPLSALQDGQWLPDGFRVLKVRDQWYRLSPRRYADMKALAKPQAAIQAVEKAAPADIHARKDSMLAIAIGLLLAIWLPLIGIAHAIDWKPAIDLFSGDVAQSSQQQPQQKFTCCSNVMFPKHEADI